MPPQTLVSPSLYQCSFSQLISWLFGGERGFIWGLLGDDTVHRQNSYMGMVHSLEYIMTSYYDIVLGLIPAALFGIGGTLTLLGVQLTFAVPMAAVVAIGLIGHALFVNQPGESAAKTTPQSRSNAPVSAD